MGVADAARRRDRFRRLLPFAAIALAPLVLAATSLDHTWALVVASGLSLTVGFVIVLTPWERLHWGYGVVPVVLYCSAVGFARHAESGSSSSLTLLLLLPVLWQALYSERVEVYIALAVSAAAQVVPIVLLGRPEYPPAQWKGVAVWLIVAPVAAAVVHRLVDRLRASEANLSRIAHLAHSLTTAGDNRETICRAAMEVAGADLAYLLEPRGERVLMSTAAAGVLVPPFEINMGDEPSGAVDAYRSGTPRFVADTSVAPVSQRIVAMTGATSVYFQPVLRGEEIVGVVVVGWQSAQSAVGNDTRASMALLAAEAAVAMERADQLSAAAQLARVDPLTGLPNRRCWDEEASRAVAARHHHPEPLSVALIDIDRFKAFNDTHGHQAGDRFLKEATAAWRSSLREGDLLARWGGEEFAVLLPRCPGWQAVEVLERLRMTTPLDQSCSIGLTEVGPEDTLSSVVERSDAALYAAKAAGRDRVERSDLAV